MTNCIKRNISDRGLPVTCSSVHGIGEVPGFHTPVRVSFLSSKAVGRRAVFAWTPGGFKKCAQVRSPLVPLSSRNTTDAQ